MFSHPAPAPPPQQPSGARVPGDPAREQRWAGLTAQWQPHPRVTSSLTWAWLRSAWEALDDWQPPVADRPEPAAGPTRDLRLLDGALTLQRAFDAAARGMADDGDCNDDASPEGVLREEDGEPLHEAGLGTQIARELVRRQGRTRLFAELWSVSHPEELAGDPWSEQPRQPDPQGEDPVYPLSGDDIAWIVSGSSTAQKHSTWLWTERFEA